MADDSANLATCGSIEEGIAYLTQDSKKDNMIELNGNACSRVSCSWNSAIQLCNQGDSKNETSMGGTGRNADVSSILLCSGRPRTDCCR